MPMRSAAFSSPVCRFSFLMNCTIPTLISRPQARIISPRAAVVLPFPSPVLTITRPRVSPSLSAPHIISTLLLQHSSIGERPQKIPDLGRDRGRNIFHPSSSHLSREGVWESIWLSQWTHYPTAAGRSPDFRQLPPNLPDSMEMESVVQNRSSVWKSDSPFPGVISRSQWRGRGGFSPPSLFSRADPGQNGILIWISQAPAPLCLFFEYPTSDSHRAVRLSAFCAAICQSGKFQAKEEGEPFPSSRCSRFDPPFPSKDRPPSSAGLRTRGLCARSAYRSPLPGHTENQCSIGDFRSHSPLRGSPGFSPGSLFRALGRSERLVLAGRDLHRRHGAI